MTTVTPNQTRLELLETRHLDLSVHIKYEENGAWKSLQTAAQRLGQKSEKEKKKKKQMVDEVAKMEGLH